MQSNFLESDFLSDKRILIFSVNRIQSEPTVNHVKDINQHIDEFYALGIEDVYCVAFSDFALFDFLMPKLSSAIKFVQDTNTECIAKLQQILDKKGNRTFLSQYWQFACVLNRGTVELYIEQPFDKKKFLPDTRDKIYSHVGPEKVLEELRD